ncbi:S1 family peptidase [Butyrivibrio fibrisolvens]|uniref:Trypsin-like peptidase domain-containing protein n=1 Tax=Butyrivibrio fibrisolvens TaxID=831 RepID=A0A317G1B7_BUTFI|nr:serine protease [Butyrivibrio fibrisolvens]PWT26222.1 hypothetical protein CPT75_03345 [Butyrivibrio fibrisolvens]
METEININQYSLSSFYCEAYFGSKFLSNATCFLTKRDDQFYLVTNWHVVTGRHPDTGDCLSPSAAIPDNLRVYFLHETVDGIEHGEYQKISLVDDEGNPLWKQKQVGSRYVDVVVIPIVVDERFTAFCIEDAEEPFNESPHIEVTSPLYVLGFPFGQQWGILPIWKKATIASEPEYESDEGFPYFFVDTASRPGMSGSPVVLFERRPVTIAENLNGGKFSMHFTKFIGVYSGRIVSGDKDEAQLGRVWKASVIEELIKG